MRYRIFSEGELINTIVADEEFVKNYCSKNNYTYEVVQESVVEDETEPTADELINAFLGVTSYE